MCKDCGCSFGGASHSHANLHAHTHSRAGHSHGHETHTHAHTHEDGTTHSHAHMHEDEAHKHAKYAHEVHFHSHDNHTHDHHAHGEHSHTHAHTNSQAHPVLGEAKSVEVISKILAKNDEQAAHNRAHFNAANALCINLMSSPGSGKTTLLESTVKALKELKISVIEGDLETENDAVRVREAGANAYQITTGQSCHLDAFMVHEALHHLNLKDCDLLFIENVGNLVCPASYDLGEHLNVVLLSVTEGDDKPAKYPVMFRKADLVVISKADLANLFDFDIEKAKKECKKLNPKVEILVLDAKNGTNLHTWCEYLKLKKELI